MTATWYYKFGKIVVGPVTFDELLDRARSGALHPETPARNGDAGEWTEARLIPGLMPNTFEVDAAAADRRASISFAAVPGRLAQFDAVVRPLAAKSWYLLRGRAAVIVGLVVLGAVVFSIARRPSPTPANMPDNSEVSDELGKMRDELARLRRQIGEAGEARPKAEEGDSAPDEAEPVHVPKNALAAIVAKVEASVVQIETTRSDGQAITGSGFIAHAKGLVVTNYHVIEGATKIAVVFHDKTRVETEAFRQVIPGRDIAVIEVKLPDDHRVPLTFVDGEIPKGADAIAFGSPLGLQLSVSEGIVSAVRKGDEVCRVMDELTVPGFYGSLFDLGATWIQTTTPISHGNSGGPLTDSAGNVMGMNTWSLSLLRDAGAQNVNFAIAAEDIRAALATAWNGSVKHLSRLPAPREMAQQPPRPVPMPGPDAPAIERQKAQVALMHRIYEQRALLISRRELASVKLQNLEVGFSAANASLVKVEAEGLAIRQTGALLEQQAAVIRNRLAFEQDPRIRQQLQGLLNTAVQSYAAWQTRYQGLDAEAARLRIYGGKLQSEGNGVKADVARLREQADQLRTEWLNATNAFGKLVSGDYDGAVAAFSEWIVLEADNPLPYVARGLAHQNAGNAQLASADFKKASQIDPKTTAAMLKDLQGQQAGPPNPRRAGRR